MKNYQYLRLKREIKTKPYLVKMFNSYIGYRRYIFNRAKELHMFLLKDKYGLSFSDVDKNNISFEDIRNYIKRNSKLEWENEYSSQIIDTAIEDYFDTYVDYMKGVINNLPKFKKKYYSKESFRFNMKQWNVAKNQYRTFHVENNRYLFMPRFRNEVGPIKLKEPLFYGKYENFPSLEGFQINSVTIKREADRYYAIFCIRFIEGSLYKDLPEVAAGLDVGIRNLATIAYRKKKDYKFDIYNSDKIRKKYKHYKSRIKWYQKMLSRKVVGSKLWLKTRTKLQRVYKKITNFTEYYIHLITTDIVNSYMYLCIDMFKVNSLIRIIHNARVRDFIYRNNTYRFYQYILYKYDLYGGILIEPEDNFSSTNICSACGYMMKRKERLKLIDKKFKCPNCNFKIDRDINASINLEKYLLDYLK